VRVAVQPDFPETERERGAHGTSVVLVTIDPKGNVVKAAVGSSSGYPGLDRAAMVAARESQFVAPRINGHPATETYRVVYDFNQ
jgi:protein TonB